MYNLWDIEEIKKILGSHGFSFSKSLGQNFIINPDICPEMVDAADIGKDDCVLEIGPGIGVLTQQLCLQASKVAAIELDKRLPDLLRDTLKDFENVKIIQGDALKMDLSEIVKTEFPDAQSVKICANLPYYITTPVIMKVLKEKLPVKSITVMVQKEAGERLCAEVGSRNAGAISAAVCYYSQTEELFAVGKENFYPRPKVDSEVIRLIPRNEPPVKVKDEKLFFELIRASFAQRRKSAVNSISAGLGIPKTQVAEILDELGFEPTIRAEKFTLNDFANICDIIQR